MTKKITQFDPPFQTQKSLNTPKLLRIIAKKAHLGFFLN